MAVLEEALSVEIIFYLPKPKSMKQSGLIPHIKRPDTDNLIKSTLDALKQIWKDDCIATRIIAEKFHADKTGAHIVISTYEKKN
jgi:Holliday junction resolvase RusA-like endonuclease